MASEIPVQLEPWSHLHGKIVMVTGASSGLGLQICLDLAKVGCRIVAAARRVDKLNSLCNQINKMNVRIGGVDEVCSVQAIALHLDITSNGPTIKASVEKAWNAFGHIDVLINNAGVRGPVKSASELSEEEWNYEMKTNLTGTWIVSKYMSLHMRDAAAGSIINISSISGLNRVMFRGGVAYNSSKAAIDHMTKVMALELGDYNIRVNLIAVGLVMSQITEKLFNSEGFKNVMKRTGPLVTGTIHPTIASLIYFLIHDSSNYITGNVFIVDAGYTLLAFPIFSSL